MAAENILGKLIIEGANRAGGIAGGAPSLGSGLAGGGGGGTGGPRSAEMETRGFQKTVKDAQLKAVNFAKEQPKWWTRTFKTLGIQMGLAGILKQSQVFTSTIGAFFQIFGAMVDVMLVPLVKPVLMPLMRWFARQIPTMGRLSKAVFGFLGSTILAIIRLGTKMVGWGKDTYDWLKAKGTDIWNGIKNVGSIKWWQDSVFKPIWDTITDIPGKIVSGIRKAVSWDTWSNIFRNLWNATLGGVKVGGKGISFTFPTWRGGSTFEMENLKTPGHTDPTLVTVDSDGNVLSYESTGGGNIESGFKTGLDKEGNVLEEKYGKNMEKTGKVLLGVWEWMKNTKKGDAPRTLAGYTAYKEQWMKDRAAGTSWTNPGDLTAMSKDTAQELKEMFDDLHIAIKGALGVTGVSLTAMYAKDIGNSVTRALGTVTKGALSPVRAVKGLIDGILAQVKIGDQKSFIKHLRAGKGVTGAARAALSNFQFGFQPSKAPTALVDEGLGAAFDASTSGSSSRMLDAGEEAFGLVDQHGNKLARSIPKAITHDPDVLDNQSILRKARTLLKNLTAYVLRQLRNIGGILKNPTLVNGVKQTIGRMADEIEALLRPLANSVPEAQTILAATRVSKNFLLRSLPVVGAAIGFAETAYNIKSIAQSDLSWIVPRESKELTRDIERMRSNLGLSQDYFEEASDLGWGPIDLIKRKLLTSAGTESANTAWLQGAGTPLMHSKAGAILTQLLLGTMSTGAGVVGLPGLPISLSAAAAQEVHRMGVLNNDDTILQGLVDAFTDGVKNKDRGLKIQIDGLDASLFNGLY